MTVQSWALLLRSSDRTRPGQSSDDGEGTRLGQSSDDGEGTRLGQSSDDGGAAGHIKAVRYRVSFDPAHRLRFTRRCILEGCPVQKRFAQK